jgi:hypothetical protein
MKRTFDDNTLKEPKMNMKRTFDDNTLKEPKIKRRRKTVNVRDPPTVEEIKNICSEHGVSDESYNEIISLLNGLKTVFQWNEKITFHKECSAVLNEYMRSEHNEANIVRLSQTAAMINKTLRSNTKDQAINLVRRNSQYDSSANTVIYAIVYRIMNRKFPELPDGTPDISPRDHFTKSQFVDGCRQDYTKEMVYKILEMEKTIILFFMSMFIMTKSKVVLVKLKLKNEFTPKLPKPVLALLKITLDNEERISKIYTKLALAILNKFNLEYCLKCAEVFIKGVVVERSIGVLLEWLIDKIIPKGVPTSVDKYQVMCSKADLKRGYKKCVYDVLFKIAQRNTRRIYTVQTSGIEQLLFSHASLRLFHTKGECFSAQVYHYYACQYIKQVSILTIDKYHFVIFENHVTQRKTVFDVVTVEEVDIHTNYIEIPIEKHRYISWYDRLNEIKEIASDNNMDVINVKPINAVEILFNDLPVIKPDNKDTVLYIRTSGYGTCCSFIKRMSHIKDKNAPYSKYGSRNPKVKGYMCSAKSDEKVISEVLKDYYSYNE